ncbi:MAG TPA: hypothetical protein VFE59_18770 [Trebonia sp.]|jgi:hypothetical protein|nr:hypothetical protein [Trebonia sp.]
MKAYTSAPTPREEQTRIAGTTVEEDRVELVETDDTYLELWERRSPQDRGAWLVEQGFRVTASKERVAVEQGDVQATLDLGEPERIKPTRHLERKYWGTCECGCGTDLYGTGNSRKRYVDQAHKAKAKRQREAAGKAQAA